MKQLHKLLIHDIWANDELLKWLGRHQPVPPRSLDLLGHVAGAERLWLARLGVEETTLEVWPSLKLEGCAKELGELAILWRRYLEDLPRVELTRQVDYTNSKGERWKSSVEDILTHVPIHSAYHRGQIALELRNAGLSPPYTDYIHAARHGFLG